MEVRQSGINKGSSITSVISGEGYDFIFAVGDDRTDEDMFKALIGNENAVTIKVGPEASYAQFNLHTSHMVVSLLDSMTHIVTPVLLS